MKFARLLRRLRVALILAGMFLYDLVASSLAVARIVLAREDKAHPAIVAVPTRLQTPWGMSLLAYFTTVTPGSCCLHVDVDKHMLYIHMLNAPSDEAVIHRFQTLYERWILELERP